MSFDLDLEYNHRPTLAQLQRVQEIIDSTSAFESTEAYVNQDLDDEIEGWWTIASFPLSTAITKDKLESIYGALVSLAKKEGFAIRNTYTDRHVDLSAPGAHPEGLFDAVDQEPSNKQSTQESNKPWWKFW